MEEQLTKVLQDGFGLTWEDATPAAVYAALHRYTQQQMEAMPPCAGKKKLYYVSAEFLMGKLLSNNLINLRLFDEAKAVLKSHGFSLEEIEEQEPEPSLGNGGLGRLAACFLDSIATLNLPGDGAGLCYRDGLFRQRFVDLKQQEDPNPWITPSAGSPTRASTSTCPSASAPSAPTSTTCWCRATTATATPCTSLT